MIHVIIIMIIIIVIYSSIVETGDFSFSLWKCRKKFYVDPKHPDSVGRMLSVFCSLQHSC